MIPARLRDLIPAEPPERSRTLDPRIGAEFARNRRIHNLGFAAITAIYLGLALAELTWKAVLPGTANAPAPGWLNAVAAGCIAVTFVLAVVTVRSWRCPSCHRYLYRELVWPGTRIELCPRCGVRLA